MNPIPLSAPDGQVYAYACGVCHHVPAGASMGWREPGLTGPVPQLVEGLRWKAEECCRCGDCKVPRASDERGLCGDCTQWMRWRRLWINVGEAVAWGVTTAEQWLARWSAEEDDDA